MPNDSTTSRPHYRPIGELRERGSMPYQAQWRAYTDDPESPWGPNGMFGSCGADVAAARIRDDRSC